jgi:NAD(P)H-dependent FMN reductase
MTSKKIIAFAGSSSQNSINKKLASYAAHLFENATVEVLDLNDYEMPIYSSDREKESGVPQKAVAFFTKISEADIIVLSLAEHNGAYATAFKNIFDWVSRYNNKFFQQKPLLLLATSPGPRGGMTVLEIAKERFPRHDAQLMGTFSLPSFNDNFQEGKISNALLNTQLKEIIASFS